MKIILSDGTEINNLILNGNNYVSKSEVTEAMFRGKLKSITVVDEKGEEQILSNCELVKIQKVETEWYFILREMTAEEVQKANNDAQILYTAMMTDTLIESEEA